MNTTYITENRSDGHLNRSVQNERWIGRQAIIISLLILFSFGLACDLNVDSPDGDGEGDASDGKTDLGTPATEHHGNDGVKDNGDGTSEVVLGNTSFNTSQRDFSSEPVVTDPKTVAAQKGEEYPLNLTLNTFRISAGSLFGFEKIDAFTSKILLYDLSSKSVSDEHEPDFFLVGFDYNGSIMTVEGAEDVNFYKVEDGKIQAHFFQIKSFYGSKFLSTCYLDHDQGYVFNSDELLTFPLHDTSNITKLIDIPSFSQLRMSSDSDFLYIAVADFASSVIKIYNKAEAKVDKEITVADAAITSIVVDANYIYYATGSGGQIRVVNKHTYASAGQFNATNPTAIDKVDDTLYSYSEDNKTVTTYDISFQ